MLVVLSAEVECRSLLFLGSAGKLERKDINVQRDTGSLFALILTGFLAGSNTRYGFVSKNSLCIKSKKEPHTKAPFLTAVLLIVIFKVSLFLYAHSNRAT